MGNRTTVYMGEGLSRYGFGERHPFSRKRHDALVEEFYQRQLYERVMLRRPVMAGQAGIGCFHSPEYRRGVIRTV